MNRKFGRRNFLTSVALPVVGTAMPRSFLGRERRLPAVDQTINGSTQGGTLRMSNGTGDAISFHPYLTTDSNSSNYQGYVYGISMSKRDPQTLEQVPFGATWTVSDDMKTYTFTLKDMQWSDGRPITTDDFVWTYLQATTPENQYPYADNLSLISSYEARDPRTLEVTLRDALTVGLEAADSITPLPRHIWERYPWSDPSQNPEILHPSVVSGMWRLEDWQKSNHATFVANDYYFDGRPNIDTLQVMSYRTGLDAYTALKYGVIDYFPGFAPANYQEAKTLPNVTVDDWYPAAGDWGYIGFNLRRSVLKDIRVRKALAYATNRNGIISNALLGLGKPIYAGFVQESPVFTSNVEHYDFDLEKAKGLLSQAGYTPNSDDLMTMNDQPLVLKLIYPTSSAVRTRAAVIIGLQLAALGITVLAQGLDFQTYVSAIKTPPYDWDLQLGDWLATIDPYWNKDIWSEKWIPSLNASAYVNSQVEQLFDQASREFDGDRRAMLYAQIQQALAEDLPYIFLYELQEYAGFGDRVAGITPTSLGIQYNMNKWYLTS
jgi:peptide/nickel transport system substrate-binding protein